MSSCRKIEIELVAYCSGELDSHESEMVRRHLDGCSACREELGREMELRRTLGSLTFDAAPAGLEQRITAATLQPVTTLPGSRNRGRRTATLLAIAASLALALLVPTLRPDRDPGQDWSEAEIASARQDLMYTLALTARVIDRTRKDAVVNVFADKLPRAIDESFKMVKPTTSGGNG